jgi:transposase
VLIPAQVTPDEKELLVDWYRQGTSALIRNRAHAILMNSQGLSAKKISGFLFRDYKTVRDWLTDFKNRRIASLFSQYLNNHNAGKLTPEQKTQVKQILSRPPSDYGIPKEFWQVTDLKRWIKAEFGVVYESDRSYHFLFKLGRFSWKLPDKFDATLETRSRLGEDLPKSETRLSSSWLQTTG